MPNHENFVSMEVGAQVVHYLDRVLFHLRYVHGLALQLAVIGFICLAGATLVPLNDSEVLLPSTLEKSRHRYESDARPAVKEEQDGIVYVITANFDPLVNAANSDLLQVVDAVRGVDGTLLGNLVLQVLTVQEGKGNSCDDQAKDDYPEVFEDSNQAKFSWLPEL